MKRKLILSFHWYFPEKVPKFHEKYLPFNEVAGKSRSGSRAANCYCLERCVIFTKATRTGQSINTTWTHGTRCTYPKLAKTFLFWVTVPNSLSFPWFFVFFPNSLSFPWLENWKLIFKVFPDFQSGWEPCSSCSHLHIKKYTCVAIRLFI